MSNSAVSSLGAVVKGPRRRFTAEQKRALLAEAAKPGSPDGKALWCGAKAFVQVEGRHGPSFRM